MEMVNTQISEKVIAFKDGGTFKSESKRFADFVSDGYLNITLDASNMRSIGSDRVGMILMLNKALKEFSGKFKMINVSEDLYKDFVQLNLADAIPMELSCESDKDQRD